MDKNLYNAFPFIEDDDIGFINRDGAAILVVIDRSISKALIHGLALLQITASGLEGVGDFLCRSYYIGLLQP